MSYTNTQIAKQIASLLNKNKTPIFQKGTTSSTGINKEITVRMSNGKVVRALGWNVSTPGEVNVFWDAQNKRYVAWKEEINSLKRKTILVNRKTRPDEKKYAWEYFIKVLQPSSVEGFDSDVALSLAGYTPLEIINTGSGYFAVLKQSNNNYIFLGENTVTTVNIPNADFANLFFFLYEEELSPYRTQKTIATLPTMSWTIPSGASLYSSNFFSPINLRYADSVPNGYLGQNNDYFIPDDTCVTNYVLKTPDNVIHGNITQTITHESTGRTDTAIVYNYTYTGNYSIPHERVSLSVDGYSTDKKTESVMIDVNTNCAFNDSSNRVETTTQSYTNTRKSNYTLGTDANPIYDTYYDITAQGSTSYVITKPKIYKLTIAIVKTGVPTGFWTTTSDPPWEAFWTSTGVTDITVLSGVFYSLSPTVFNINYTITSTPTSYYSSVATPNGEITNTSYTLVINENYRTFNNQYSFGAWQSSSHSLGTEKSYYTFTSPAGLVLYGGQYTTIGYPVLETRLITVEEVYIDSGFLYNGTSTIVNNSTVLTANEVVSFEIKQNVFLKNNIDCELYRTTEDVFSQTHVNNYNITYPSGAFTSTLNRYEEITYNKPPGTSTINIVINNSTYKITDYKNNTIDAEDRFVFYTNNNNYNLDVGSITLEGYGTCGTTYNNYPTRNSNNAIEKIIKQIFTSPFSSSGSYYEPSLRFSTNTFNWVGKTVDIFQSVDGQVKKGVGTITSADSSDPEEITVNITNVTTEAYQIVAENYFDGLIVCSSSDYTSLLLNNFSNFNKQSNLYTVTDENGNETVELAIAEIPTTTTPETLRADIYRFNTSTLKWERRPNAITPVSPLTDTSSFVSYHPTPSNSRKKRNRPPRS